MNAAAKSTWISACEDQIASMCDCMTWSDEDEEMVIVLQGLVVEWAEAVAQ
jgi:hypothetical protein